MKTTTVIIIIVVVACVLLGALAAGGVGIAAIANQPEIVAANALKGALTDIFERQELKAINKTLTQGSVTVSVDGVKCGEEDLMDGMKVSGKVYFSEAKKAVMIEDLVIKDDEHKIQGTVYVSEDMVYISEEEIVQGAYGAKFNELADDLADSIFAYGSGSEYAIPDKETYETIINVLEGMNNEKMQKDAEKVLEELEKEAIKAMKKNFEFISENEEVRIDGNREKVRVVSIIIDGEDLSAAIEDYYDFLANDDSMIEFLETYEDEIALITDTLYDGMLEEGKSLAEMYEDALDEFGDNLDDICDDIEESMDDEELIVKVITPRNSHNLVKLEVEAAGEEIFALEIGMDGVKKTDKITVTVAKEKYVYEVEENSRKEYVGTFKADGTTVEFKVNRENSNYTLKVQEEGETMFTAKGDFISKGNTTKITVDRVTIKEYDYWSERYEEVKYDCKISVEMDQNDKIPAVPKKYNTIADITEKDIEKWIERVSGEKSAQPQY